MIDRGDHELALAVERRAAPVDAAGVTRRLDRSLQARRRENALRAIARDQIAALAAIVESESPCILRRNCRMRRERRRRGEWLRRRGHLACDVGLRDRPLDDFEHRLAGLAVEYEQHAGLRC